MEGQSLPKTINYKELRMLCTKGKDTQDKIFQEYGIEINTEEPIEYLKYLINLSVGNTEIQHKIFELLPRIECNSITGKLLMILSNNILSDSFQLRKQFINENQAIVNFCIDAAAEESEEIFEWAYYLLSKLHPGGLRLLFPIVLPCKFTHIIQFINARLENCWESEQSMIPSIIALDDLRFVCSITTDENQDFLLYINFASRQISEMENIVEVLLSTGALDHCYTLLKGNLSDGFIGVILQIIANTICLKTIPLLLQNVDVVLRSGELNIKQITSREWVFVIIRNAIPLSAQFHEILNTLYKTSLH